VFEDVLACSRRSPDQSDRDFSAAMTAAKFYVTVLLIAGALFALRLCDPNARDYDKKHQEVRPT